MILGISVEQVIDQLHFSAAQVGCQRISRPCPAQVGQLDCTRRQAGTCLGGTGA
jgi:hypothetical protein